MQDAQPAKQRVAFAAVKRGRQVPRQIKLW